MVLRSQEPALCLRQCPGFPPAGSLRLQVRPGHWVVEVVARSTGIIEALPVPEVKAPWPSEEVWVFQAHTDLRLVEPDGLPAVDPRQTTLPEGWRELPAFLAKPGKALSLKLVRQGDADPAMDQISIKRELWLDLDGRGYTVQDVIEGTMSRTHRLEASENLLLGRVNVSGEDMLGNMSAVHKSCHPHDHPPSI